MEKDEIVLYQPDNSIRLEVELADETVWLTQMQSYGFFPLDKHRFLLMIPKYQYQTDIPYHKRFSLNWFQCMETRKKIVGKGEKSSGEPLTSTFEYVTNIGPTKEIVIQLSAAGRLLWKIENEGFNTQKCGEYEMEHKYCRKSYIGMKNYYTLLQLTHAINQLVEKSNLVAEYLKEHSWKNH